MAQQEELKRIVLFFDAHEAFWGHQRDLPEEVFFQRDEWLRCLLRAHALYLAPDDTYIHKNKGLVLHMLGFLQARRSLQVRLSENIEALESWQGAVAAFSCYLTIATGDEYIRNLRDLLQKFLDNL
jgi:hypothetical protein